MECGGQLGQLGARRLSSSVTRTARQPAWHQVEALILWPLSLPLTGNVAGIL